MPAAAVTAHRQRLVHQRARLHQMAVELPVSPERRDQSERDIHVAGVDRPPHCAAKVRVIQPEAPDDRSLPWTRQVWCSGFGQRQERHRVPAPNLLLASIVAKLPQRVCLDGLQDPESDFDRVVEIARKEALVEEIGEGFEDIALPMDGAGLGDVEPPVEHRDVLQEAPAIRRQQLVAPGDGSLECPLSIGDVPTPRARQWEV
jgi:hypothetical protein